MHARLRAVGVVTAILATAALDACGQDSATIETPRSPSAQALADMPNYPKSIDRWGVVIRDDGLLLTQSFVVRGAGRERIVSWFDDRLRHRGWVDIEEVRTDGRLASRLLFMKDQRLLVVAIASAPVVTQLPPFDEPTSKYSLLLYPHGLPTFAGSAVNAG